MIITLEIRLEEFPDMHPRILTTSGSTADCMAFLEGLLVKGVIIDSFKTMGVK